MEALNALTPARLFMLVVILLSMTSSLSDPFAASVSSVKAGDNHLLLTEYTFASQSYEAAIAAGLDGPGVQLRLAHAEEGLHQWDVARIHYEDASQSPWTGPRALTGLARIAEAQEDVEQAALVWGQAAPLQSNDPAIIREYCEFLWKRGDFQNVSSAIDRWLRLSPGDERACTLKAVALLVKGDAEAARDSLQCAAQSGSAGAAMLLAALSQGGAPGSLEFNLRAGVALLSIGEHQAAFLLFQQARGQDPASPVAASYYAYCLSRAGDDSGAREILRDVIRRAPSYPMAWYFLGALEAEAGRLEEARECYERLLTLDPKNSAACVALGDTWAAEDRLVEAETWYQKGVELSPDDGRFWLTLAQFYVKHLAGVAGRGVVAARKAVELLPNDAATQDTLGWALFLSNDFAGARDSLDIALRLDGRLASAQYHAGTVYYTLGNREKALYHLTRVLDLEPGGRFADLAGDLLRQLKK